MQSPSHILTGLSSSFIWCLIVGVANIKAMMHDGVSGKLMAAYIIQAALYLALCLLSLVVFYAGWTVSMPSKSPSKLLAATWQCRKTAAEQEASFGG